MIIRILCKLTFFCICCSWGLCPTRNPRCGTNSGWLRPNRPNNHRSCRLSDRQKEESGPRLSINVSVCDTTHSQNKIYSSQNWLVSLLFFSFWSVCVQNSVICVFLLSWNQIVLVFFSLFYIVCFNVSLEFFCHALDLIIQNLYMVFVISVLEFSVSLFSYEMLVLCRYNLYSK